MSREKFPVGVAERLGWYVYRLIDPRNAETFYVGKGCGDRLFQHAKGVVVTSEDEDAAELKLQRIKDIKASGFDVAHVIHRHMISNEKIAYEIEAALIDAYPGLANRLSGHGSDDFGARHAEEIIAEYAAKPFVAREALILISINQTYQDEKKDIYNAVRGVWKINRARAKAHKLVLAHRRGLVVGAFRPTEWVSATTNWFPWLANDIEGRSGFVGAAASDVEGLYLRKRVPDSFRKKGAANPIRFIPKDQNVT